MAKAFLRSVLTAIALLQWFVVIRANGEVTSLTTVADSCETEKETETCTEEQTVTETCTADPTTEESCTGNQTVEQCSEETTGMETCTDGITVEETCTEVDGTTLPETTCASEEISQFNQCFEEEVQKCETLRNLFDVEKTISAEEYFIGKFYLVTAIAARAGAKNPVLISVLATRYIASRDIILKSGFLVAVYSDSAAKSLYAEGKLDSSNAPAQAKSLADFMREAAEQIVNEDNPRSKVTALPTGYANFFLNAKASVETVARVYGDEWKYQLETRDDIVNADEPVNCCSEVASVLQPCNKFCAAKSDAMEQFKDAFYEAVKSCETLTSLFQISPALSSAEISKGTFYMYQYILQQRGVADNAVLADYMSKYILKLETVSSSVLLAFHAEFVVKYMVSEGRLTTANCRSLAAKYAGVLFNRAKAIVDEQFPRSKLVTLALGTRLFLLDVGLLDASKGVKFAYYYGSEWYCQSNAN